MTTERMGLEKLVAGVSTRANLISYFNSNIDIIDAYLAKSNWAAGALDPDADNDDSEGYAAGSRWYTTTAIWECVDASTGAAVWHQVWPALTAELSGSITNAQLAGSIADDKLANSYAILAGRAGGQTLKGDTASGGNLTLQSTSHATRGQVKVGTTVYDEVNNWLGIGCTPLARLQSEIGLIPDATILPGLILSGTYATTSSIQSLDFRYTNWEVSPIRLGATFNADGLTMELIFMAGGLYNADGVERVRIAKNGNLCVGCTSATERLQVSGNGLLSGTVKAQGGLKYTLAREANISIASGEVQSYACPAGQMIELANDTYGTTIAAGGFLVIS